MDKVTTVGIDLAKRVFALHGVDGAGRVGLRKTVRREQLMQTVAALPPCLIGMEACSGAHEWARRFQELGHTVRLMAPVFVAPYRKSGKHDGNDAEAIGEAVSRPNMRFVPIKSAEQQALLALHCARSGWVKARTAQVNQIRGLLSEFGIVLPQGITRLRHRLPEILEDGDNGLPGLMRALLSTLQTHLKELDQQIVALEREIVAWHRRNENSRRLERVPGIGPITASALVASIGNAHNFKNGRQLAAWLGLVPAQDSSGGKTKLLGISKHGDVYLRTLLIHGARAVLRHLEHRPAATNSWLARLVARRNRNVAAVALANKNARIAWAL